MSDQQSKYNYSMRMQSLPITTIFVRRLIIGWILSWIIVIISVYDVGSISFIFSDGSIMFFALGTGPLIALCSSWHQLLPIHHRKVAVISSILLIYLFGFLAFQNDLSHREELDALVTLFVIGPQIVLMGLCVTIFGMKDILSLRKNNH